MKITSPIGLNLLVDGNVPKVWNLFCFPFNFLALYLHSQMCSPYISFTGTDNTLLLLLLLLLLF